MPQCSTDPENMIVEIPFDRFPAKHTCDGGNISPAVRFSRVHSASIALIMEDHIGPLWIIWNIDPGLRSIPEGIPGDPVLSSPIAAVQGKNRFGKTGYSGPCPDAGATHIYYFNAYGLDTFLDLPGGSGIAELRAAMHGHQCQYGGEAVATYGR